MANCSDCHGTHDILKVGNPDSRVFPFNLPETCGNCHADAKLAEEHNIPVAEAYQTYLKSVHGRGLLKSGLLLAADCTDCHGVHDIEPHTNPKSRIHPGHIAQTCGACHQGVIQE